MLQAFPLVLAAGVAATFAVAPAATAEPGVPPTDLPDPVSAQRAAVRWHSRVEVLGQRTETTQVFANPNGTFTAESALRPVRVKHNRVWVPVDATLHRSADGSVVPAAATLPLVLSGGGTGPIARVVKDGKELAVSWPGRLPAPVLSGSTATYPNVLPDVDLRVQAEVDGFSEVLVVKTRVAAKNPALRSLTFGTSVKGVSITVDQRTGAVNAVDKDGKVVFGGSTPMMWDSHATAPAAKAAAKAADAQDGAEPQARQRPMRTHAGAGALTVQPDLSLLDAPDTDYPVQIDPSWPGAKNHWTMLWEQFGSTSYYDRTCVNCDADERQSGVVRVGYQSWEGVSLVRSLFEMDTSRVLGTHIDRAVFRITQSWSGKACGGTAGPTSLYWTPGINSGSNWNTAWNKDDTGWGTKLGSNSDVRRWNCGQAGVEFDATSAVRGAVAAGAGNVTLGLRADNESDKYAWRRYQLDPVLSVEYDSYPTTPTDLRTAGQYCSTGDRHRPHLGLPGQPQLSATLYSPDNTSLTAYFDYGRLDAAGNYTPVGTLTQSNVPSGSTASVTLSGIPDGTYRWSVRGTVRASDGATLDTPTAEPCEFSLDTVAPSAAPIVESTDYPADNQAHLGVGQAGNFTLRTNGVTDADYFLYGLTDPPSQIAAVRGMSTAAVRLAPMSVGVNTLYVQTRDAAGNASAITRYVFQVGLATPSVDRWLMSEDNATTLADTGVPGGHLATATGGVTLHQQVATFDGTGLVKAADTDALNGGPFTVSAWTRPSDITSGTVLSSADGNFVVYLSQGTLTAEFAGWDGDDGTDMLGVWHSAGPANAWTHLVVEYDVAGDTSLYLNGVRVSGVKSSPSRYPVAGGLFVGQGFKGDIRDVRLWNRLVTDAEVAAMATGADVSKPPLAWGMDDGAGTSVNDDSGNGRAGTVYGGATWGPGHDPSGADSDDPTNTSLRFTPTGQYVATAKPVLRTDLAFTVSAWVDLTNTSATAVAVSQDGNRCSGFQLGYDKGSNRWVASRAVSDADGAAVVSASSSAAPQVGRWTHLAAVYDPGHQELRLYVNGQLQSKAAFTVSNAWNATGAFVTGRGWSGGAATGWWSGGIDDVRVYQGVLSDSDIALLSVN